MKVRQINKRIRETKQRLLRAEIEEALVLASKRVYFYDWGFLCFDGLSKITIERGNRLLKYLRARNDIRRKRLKILKQEKKKLKKKRRESKVSYYINK